MISQILKLYKDKFGFIKFYDNVRFNIGEWKEFHIQNETFLQGYKSEIPTTEFAGRISTKEGDIRVDLPVWFGNPNSAKRIVVIGSEPRDTAEELNVERVDKYVFATPFALERANKKYQNTFSDLTNNANIFVYFTDVVKDYEVICKDDKKKNDENARTKFSTKSENYRQLLLEEFRIINPTLIIGLGNDSYNKLNRLMDFAKNEYRNKIKKVRHPSYGGSVRAKEQIGELLKSI